MYISGAISVFLLCAVLPGKLGIPAALVFFAHDPLLVFLCCGFAGISGSIVFTYLSSLIVKTVQAVRSKSQKGIYIRTYLRWVIKTKTRFGLLGLSLVSPLVLSIPLGTLIAKKFYKNNFKIITYMSVSVIAWTLVYFLVFKFTNHLLDTLLRT
ncbi:MAG: hypothetical protein ACO27Q_02850 [Bacteroidia bacterium]|jgi:hypothetical protein